MTKKAFTPERLWQLKRLSDPSLSPDGKRVLITVKEWGENDEGFSSELWQVERSSGEKSCLVKEGFASHGRFSPDGKRIAFLYKKDRDSSAQINLVDVSSGSRDALSDYAHAISSFKWTADSKAIIFTSTIISNNSLRDQRKVADLRKKRKTKVRTYEKPITKFWDHWLDEDEQSTLLRIDIDSKKLINLLEGSGYELSPFTMELATSYDSAPDSESFAFEAYVITENNYRTDLIYYSATTKSFANLTADSPGMDSSPSFAPDGRLLFLQTRMPGFYADKKRSMLYDPKSKQINQLFEEFDRSVETAIWHPDGSRFYAAIDDRAHLRIYEFDIEN